MSKKQDKKIIKRLKALSQSMTHLNWKVVDIEKMFKRSSNETSRFSDDMQVLRNITDYQEKAYYELMDRIENGSVKSE